MLNLSVDFNNKCNFHIKIILSYKRQCLAFYCPVISSKCDNQIMNIYFFFTTLKQLVFNIKSCRSQAERVHCQIFDRKKKVYFSILATII